MENPSFTEPPDLYYDNETKIIDIKKIHESLKSHSPLRLLFQGDEFYTPIELKIPLDLVDGYKHISSTGLQARVIAQNNDGLIFYGLDNILEPNTLNIFQENVELLRQEKVIIKKSVLRVAVTDSILQYNLEGNVITLRDTSILLDIIPPGLVVYGQVIRDLKVTNRLHLKIYQNPPDTFEID